MVWRCREFFFSNIFGVYNFFDQIFSNFFLGSFLYFALFRDHLEITLGSVWDHFGIIFCIWH